VTESKERNALHVILDQDWDAMKAALPAPLVVETTAGVPVHRETARDVATKTAEGKLALILAFAVCTLFRERDPHGVDCYDCGREYPFGLDMTFPFEQWKMVSPTGDDGGILCPSCMVDRASKLPGAIVVRAQVQFGDAAFDAMTDSAEGVLEREPDLWHVVRWFVGLAVEQTGEGGVYPEFALRALSMAMGREATRAMNSREAPSA
jgi:hypothetical protein